MGAADPPAIGPTAYAAWRETTLGAITEALELRTMLDLIGDPRGARTLDAGCGDGALACALASRGAEVTGLDADPLMIDAARARAARNGFPTAFVEGRLERLPFADAAFDLVTTLAVLCFVRDGRAALAEMARVLRPGGALVIGELGRGSAWAAIRRVRGWLGSKTWAAARFHGTSQLRGLAGGAGLAVASIRGAIFYPPSRAAARLMAPIDPFLGRMTTIGAAFIALRAVKADAAKGGT